MRKTNFAMMNIAQKISAIGLGMIALLGIQTDVYSQLIGYEPFNASAGTQLDSLAGWHIDGTGAAPVISSGNLNVAGLQTPIGNKVDITSGSHGFYSFSTSSLTTFVGFEICFNDLQSLDTTGAKFFAINLAGMNQVASLWIRRDGGSNFDIGLNREENVATVSWTNNSGSGFSTGTTLFALVEFDQGGPTKTANFWLSPTQPAFQFGSNDISSPLLQVISGVNDFQPNEIEFGGNPTSVSFSVDEVRVATDKATASVPEPSTWVLMLAGLGIIFSIRKFRRVS